MEDLLTRHFCYHCGGLIVKSALAREIAEAISAHFRRNCTQFWGARVEPLQVSAVTREDYWTSDRGLWFIPLRSVAVVILISVSSIYGTLSFIYEGWIRVLFIISLHLHLNLHLLCNDMSSGKGSNLRKPGHLTFLWILFLRNIYTIDYHVTINFDTYAGIFFLTSPALRLWFPNNRVRPGRGDDS